MKYDLIIIGGGAAGMFAAANAKGNVLVLERSQQLLSKVKISGGGRCNVTHHCFDPAELVKNYPRGSKELRGPFAKFQPKDTIQWFKDRGVELKTEADGRMFPITDRSETIIGCLQKAASHVEIKRGAHVTHIEPGFVLHLKTGEKIEAEKVMLATGSTSGGLALAQVLGHTIVPAVPSLFTFNVPSSPLLPLSGISVEKATVSLPKFKAKYTGPLLLTHWGFSGPAVLKLSAFCARELAMCGYQTQLKIDWVPDCKIDELYQIPKNNKLIANEPIVDLPRQLWKELAPEGRWNELSKAKLEALIQRLKHDTYQIEGKTTFKQEFVTCGGVKLSEVNFQTMESKLVPGLYFGGEVLDIDGITGGFNFQAAWTTGWLVAGQ